MDSQFGHSYSVDSELHATLAELRDFENLDKNTDLTESSIQKPPIQPAQNDTSIIKTAQANSWYQTAWVAGGTILLAGILFLIF
jgi:hypothetical protein